MASLLVVAEPPLAGMLGLTLARAGFAVRVVGDGPAALRAARAEPPDLVMLDARSPGLDSGVLARRLRAHGSAPIVVLSPPGAGSPRRPGGGEADAHVVGTFTIAELVALVETQLGLAAARRAETGPAGLARLRQPIAVGRLVVDPARRTATLGGERLPLRRREFDLLTCLALQPDVALSRSHLLREAWGWEDDPTLLRRTVDVHVRRLRRLLEPDPHHPRMLVTVRGVGYLLRSAPT